MTLNEMLRKLIDIEEKNILDNPGVMLFVDGIRDNVLDVIYIKERNEILILDGSEESRSMKHDS